MIVQGKKNEFGLVVSSKDPCGFKRQFEVLGLLKIRSDLGLTTCGADIEKAFGFQVIGKRSVPEEYLKKLKKNLTVFFSNKLELYSKNNNLQKKVVRRSEA